MRADIFHRVHAALAARTLLAMCGGYAFCWGVIALCAAGTFPLGAEFHDGETLGSILALPVYPAAFLSSLLCNRPDHATIAALVRVMALTAGVLTVAFTLTWRQAWPRQLSRLGELVPKGRTAS